MPTHPCIQNHIPICSRHPSPSTRAFRIPCNRVPYTTSRFPNSDTRCPFGSNCGKEHTREHTRPSAGRVIGVTLGGLVGGAIFSQAIILHQALLMLRRHRAFLPYIFAGVPVNGEHPPFHHGIPGPHEPGRFGPTAPLLCLRAIPERSYRVYQRCETHGWGT